MQNIQTNTQHHEKCKKHDLDLIFVFLEKSNEQNERFMCSECVKELNAPVNLIHLENASSLLTKQQNQLYREWQNHINIMVQIIKDYKLRIANMKKDFDNLIKNLDGKLDDWIAKCTDQGNLQNITLKEFLINKKHITIQNEEIIEFDNNLMDLQQNSIKLNNYYWNEISQLIIQSSEQIDGIFSYEILKNVFLKFDEQEQEFKFKLIKFNEYDNPKFQLLCPVHKNLLISNIDLRKDTDKTARLLCNQCINDQRGGTFAAKFVEEFETISRIKQQKAKEKKRQCLNEIEAVKKQIQEQKDKLNQTFNYIIPFIDSQWIKMILTPTFNYSTHKNQELTIETLQLIAQDLSQYDQDQLSNEEINIQNNQIEFQKQINQYQGKLSRTENQQKENEICDLQNILNQQQSETKNIIEQKELEILQQQILLNKQQDETNKIIEQKDREIYDLQKIIEQKEIQKYDQQNPLNNNQIINQTKQQKQQNKQFYDKYEKISVQFQQLERNFKDQSQQLQQQKLLILQQDKQIIEQTNEIEIMQQLLNNQGIQKQLMQISNFDTKQIDVKLWFRCFAFNKDETLLACGANNYVFLFNIINGQLGKHKILNGHTGDIYCITFSKTINWFITGSNDNSIISWKLDNNNTWIHSQFKQHKFSVHCLLLNKNEDQLFSGGSDKSIKIWIIDQSKNKLHYQYDLQNGHKDSVYSMSINQDENIMVSTGLDDKIIMWKKQDNGVWQHSYSLEQQNYGYRICFIDENKFAWQIQNSAIMSIFQINGNQFKKVSDLTLQLNKSERDDYLFPMIYDDEKQILMNKYDNYVYFIKVQENGKIKIQDKLNCNYYNNYGAVSNKLNYFVNWDCGWSEIRLFRINCE